MSKKILKNFSSGKKIYVLVILIVLFFLLVFFIYKNLFSSSNNNRYDGVEKHKLTNNEINLVKEKLKKVDHIDSIDIYVKSKIIRIFVELDEDVDFKLVKDASNSCLEGFKQKNLEYYDVEIFFNSANEKSELYPQIGYKHKSQAEFSW